MSDPIDEPKEIDDDVGVYDEEESRDEENEGGEGNEADSSEDEEDDDEEEMAKVRQGFIVDDDEEEEEEDVGVSRRARRKKRRRHRSPEENNEEPGKEQQQDENSDELDQDDLDLLMENTGGYRRDDTRKFKRLKRGGQEQAEEEEARPSRGLTEMFSDEEEELADEGAQDNRAGRFANEFDDFIEEDEFSDDERRRQEEREIRSSHHAQVRMPKALSSQLPDMDEEKLGEIYEVFGDGEEYEWALEAEEEADVEMAEEGAGPPELKDVFEPGELKARLLTDEDNVIRTTDMPERYQLLRNTLKSGYELNEDDFKEEVAWISKKLESEKEHFFQAKPFLVQPFQKAVRRVLEFISNDSLEVPFIWQHRKDYLMHSYEVAAGPSAKIKNEDGEMEEEKPQTGKLVSELLITRDDLWRIVHLDIEFHGILEKRKALRNMYTNLDVYDSIYEELISQTSTLVGYQDLMDFIQFRYSAQIKDLQSGSGKRHSRFGRFERIRQGKIYGLVQALGLTAEDLGENIEANQRLNFTEDPAQLPETLATEYVKSGDEEQSDALVYETPDQALEDAQQMLAEEIFYNPKIRRAIREKFWADAKIDIVLTDKGQKKIDETSPYYDFKYAINRTFSELGLRPELYLRMLLAESEGLVVVRVSYPDYKTTLFEELLRLFLSDNVSDIASAWNETRRTVFKNASRKFVPLICRNIKEDLKQDCLRSLYYDVRKSFGEKLNQAPYKPPGYVSGTTARVLTMSGGMCEFGKDAILAVMVDEAGQVVENVKFDDPRNNDFKTKLVELVNNQSPDVIGISGFSVNSTKLMDIVKNIVKEEKLTPGGDAGGAELDVIWVQDEVARLFQNSKQGISEFSEQPPLIRYCIALARYVQSPLLEYSTLGGEISAIHIHPYQYLLPTERFQDAIETVFVDYVNLVGVDINDAVREAYIGNLTQYISGLGPRKASGILQGIQSKGGHLGNRGELITEQITSKTIFMNCAAFLKIPYDDRSLKSQDTEMLDATRIHPEDYELGKKMAADALELDEEDLAGYESSGGVIAQLMHEGAEKLNELILGDYADELQKKFNQRKRETLEMIKAELLDHFGEQRSPLKVLSEMQVFTMLTGETKNTLHSGVVIPVKLRKVGPGFAIAQLSSGVDGNISLQERRPDLQFGQTVQAFVTSINYGKFSCELSIDPRDIERGLEQNKRGHQDSRKWNFTAEENDRARILRKTQEEQKTRRIIKHPLFKVMNSRQAEEYLAGKERGDLVIRPSSRGVDHIAITWKVGDNMYQHLDVLEMEKENEYSLGKYLQVDGYKYTDLDELIIGHIQAMLRKIVEMTVKNEKFSEGGPTEVEKWMDRYTAANGRATYRYCYDHKRPGWFYLCFKTKPEAKMQLWHVQVIPNGFRMMNNDYGDIIALSNGFKTTFINLQNQGRSHAPRHHNAPPYSGGYRR